MIPVESIWSGDAIRAKFCGPRLSPDLSLARVKFTTTHTEGASRAFGTC
jgi:hypothetical protein